MRLMETTRRTRDKLVVICTGAFILAAILTVLSDVLRIPAFVASVSPISAEWMELAIDAFFVLMVGAFATYLVSRLVLERTKMEEEVELRAQLLDNVTDSVFLYRPDGCFVYVNETAHKSRGLSRERLMAMNRRGLATPEYARLFDSRVKETLEKGESTFVSVHLGKDGARMPVEMRSRAIEVGGETLILSVCRDISERQKIEEELDKSQQLYSSLFKYNPDAVYAFDLDGAFTSVNQSACRITGYSSEEFLNMTFEPILIPEDLERVRQHFNRAKTGETQYYYATVISKDGRRIDLDVTNIPIVIGDKIIGVFGIAKDTTERKRAEGILRESERRYRLLAENATDVIWTVDAADPTRVIYISPSVERLLGYNVEEAMAKKMQEIFTSASFKRAMAVFAETMTGEGKEQGERLKSRALELELVHKDTSIITTEINYSLIREPDGQPAEILAVARDITERKQAENKLWQSERNLRAYMESAPDGVYISDLEGKFLYGNRKAEEITGYKREELLGKSMFELGLLPSGNAAKAGKLLALNATGKTTGPDAFELVRNDGSHVWVEIKTTPVRQGEEIQVIGFVRDIGDRQNMENRIRQAAEEWRTTFDSISDIVSIHDEDNRLVRVNRSFADVFKSTPKELIGKLCHELVHGEKQPPEDCPHKHTLRTGEPAMVEMFDPKLGIWVQESTSPIFNEKHEVTGTVCIARDITERKSREEQLIMTDRLASVGELASGTAHELNNPLTSVIGFSQLLMERDIPDDIKEDLSLIHSEAQRAAGVVKNLLTFARKHAPVKQPSQVNNIIEDVLRLRAYEQKVNNIEVKRRFAPDLPEILVDYFQMQQVFLNIIINAEYFMTKAHNKGTLTVVTERLDSIVRVSLADDGSGISGENLSKIFNPFFTTKEVGKGTGLGLSICHGIVTEHGGKIYATSHPGEGATFVVELPINSR